MPKKHGSTALRRLGILNLARPRGSRRFQAKVLEPVFEPLFLPGSYGFRPGRSVAGALAEATRRLSPLVGDGALFRALAASSTSPTVSTPSTTWTLARR